MVGSVALALAAVGLLLAALQLAALRRVLAAPSPPPPARWPGVSVLKPLKGVDPALAENLESFFALDYPELELVFAVADADDPALGVAREVAARHPQVACVLLADARSVGPNPKVNNLANAARHARHDVLLISDSNVRVEPRYVKDLAARLEQPGVGLATNLVRGTAGRGAGGALETLQLATQVAGGVALVQGVLCWPCVMGKSMMLRRSDVDTMGGWAFLGSHLAEDQVSAEEMHRMGRRIALSSRPVDNVVGRLAVPAAASRHLRWARIRRFICAPGYAGEALLCPVVMALVAVLAAPSADTALAAGLVLVASSLLAAASETLLGVRRPAWHYPVLELVRQLGVATLWPVPWGSDEVSWRGHRRRIGPRTRFEALEADRVPGGAVLEGVREEGGTELAGTPAGLAAQS